MAAERQPHGSLLRLKRWALVELNHVAFRPADPCRTTFYLHCLERHERQPGEAPLVGMVLGGGKSAERIELLGLAKHSIRAAEHLTQVPPNAVLRKRFHGAVVQALTRLEQREDGQT